MNDPAAPRKVMQIPEIQFRRVQCDHLGRPEHGKRLKDLYVAPLANGQGFLITNFSGAMVHVAGSKCPFPEAKMVKAPVKKVLV